MHLGYNITFFFYSPLSYLGLILLFLPMSLRLLKFSVYLDPRFLGLILEAEKYNIGLGS